MIKSIAGLFCFVLLSAQVAPVEERPVDLLCGVKCLYVGLLSLGVEPGSYGEFIEKHGETDARGYSLGQIEEIAKKYDVQTLAVKTSLDNLESRYERFVCIAHVDGNHFVNIGELTDNEVWIVDPPGDGAVARELFAKRWDGSALLISKVPLEAESSLGWRWRGLAWCLAIGGTMAGLWGWSRKRRFP